MTARAKAAFMRKALVGRDSIRSRFPPELWHPCHSKIASLGSERNQIAYIALTFQRPHEFDDAFRARGADYRRRIGTELRLDRGITHRISGGAGGMGNVSFMAFAAGNDG